LENSKGGQSGEGLGAGEGRGGPDKEVWSHTPAKALSAHRFSCPQRQKAWGHGFHGIARKT